jgi:hypothetical protein
VGDEIQEEQKSAEPFQDHSAALPGFAFGAVILFGVGLEDNLRTMERSREAYWLRYPATSPTKLRWRAIAVRHCFHVLPGETILELGAQRGALYAWGFTPFQLSPGMTYNHFGFSPGPVAIKKVSSR